MAMVNKLAREINERWRERVDSSLVGDVDVPGPSLASPDSFPETGRSSSNDNSFPFLKMVTPLTRGLRVLQCLSLMFQIH